MSRVPDLPPSSLPQSFSGAFNVNTLPKILFYPEPLPVRLIPAHAGFVGSGTKNEGGDGRKKDKGKRWREDHAPTLPSFIVVVFEM